MNEGTKIVHGAGRIEHHPLLGPPSSPPAVAITFNGVEILARCDEPLIASLLAAGVRVLRTMPRTGEARGGYCMVGRCSDCMVIVDGVPNVRACATPVRAGMVVETQHGLAAWPERGA